MDGQSPPEDGNTILKRMNMRFDPSDPIDAQFLALYDACTDGVKLHLCKEMILSALPDSPEKEDLLLARAMRRAASRLRGRPSGRIQRVVHHGAPVPQSVVTERQESPAAPPVSPLPSVVTAPPAFVAPTARPNVDPKTFASLAGAASWDAK